MRLNGIIEKFSFTNFPLKNNFLNFIRKSGRQSSQSKVFMHIWGTHVVIQDSNTGQQILLAHLSSVNNLQIGSQITQGQIVGSSGNSGYQTLNGIRSPIGAHLHYGVGQFYNSDGSPVRNGARNNPIGVNGIR